LPEGPFSQANGHAEPLLQGGAQPSGFPVFHGQTPAMIGLLKKPLRPPMSVSHERQAKKIRHSYQKPGFFSKSN